MTILVIVLLIALLLLSKDYILRLEPAGVFALMWILMTAAVLPLQSYIDLRFSGIIFILVCVMLFMAGTIFCDATCQPASAATRLTFRRKRAFPLLLLLFSGAMVNPLYSIILHGFSLQALLSMQDLLNMNKTISEDRYSAGGDVTNTLNQFFLIFSYAAPLLGGFCYRLVGRWTKAVCLLTLFPGMVIALTQSMKMGMITGFILWFTGYLVCAFSYGHTLHLKMRHVVSLVAILSGLFGILFISMVFRTGEISERTLIEIGQKFLTYALGHFHCFDVWYTSYEPSNLAWGTRTFLGISNALGLEDRIQGVYTEYHQVGINGYYGISNIFTIFRPLIEDFGEAGAMLVFLLLGYLSRLSLKNLCCRRNIYANQIVVSAVYAYLLWSFVASFFTYLSYVGTFFIVYFLFRFIQKAEPC